MDLFSAIFQIAIVMFSVVVHEVAHGVAADKLGDPTARYQGRLTLNPIPHLDPFGSIFLPLLLTLSGSPFLLGWAKPVPYNPFNFRRGGKWGEAIVAFAGPASNFLIALVMALLIRAELFPPEMTAVLFLVLFINVLLGIFNLIPIPPLDGSKVLSALLPSAMQRAYDVWRTQLEHNPFLGFGIIIVFILVAGSAFGNLIYTVSRLLGGV